MYFNLEVIWNVLKLEVVVESPEMPTMIKLERVLTARVRLTHCLCVKRLKYDSFKRFQYRNEGFMQDLNLIPLIWLNFLSYIRMISALDVPLQLFHMSTVLVGVLGHF